MKRSDSINIFNSIKQDANKLIEKLPTDKLSKGEIDNIINITIYSNRKYLILPKKYQECLKNYIEGKIFAMKNIKIIKEMI
jgi:hypothetical protein